MWADRAGLGRLRRPARRRAAVFAVLALLLAALPAPAAGSPFGASAGATGFVPGGWVEPRLVRVGAAIPDDAVLLAGGRVARVVAACAHAVCHPAAVTEVAMRTGRPVWSVALPGHPVATSGLVWTGDALALVVSYTGGAASLLLRISPDGSVRSELPLPPAQAGVALGYTLAPAPPGFVLLAEGEGSGATGPLYRFSPQGGLEWMRMVVGALYAVGDGAAVIGPALPPAPQEAVAVSLATGRTQWRRPLPALFAHGRPGEVGSLGARVAGRYLVQADATLVRGRPTLDVRVLALATGRPLWQRAVPGATWPGLVASGTELYACTAAAARIAACHAFRLATGGLAATYRLPGRAGTNVAPLAVSEHWLLVEAQSAATAAVLAVPLSRHAHPRVLSARLAVSDPSAADTFALPGGAALTLLAPGAAALWRAGIPARPHPHPHRKHR